MDEVFNYLKKLSEATGTSGREHNVRGVVVELVKEYADKVWLDSLGNIIALKRGKGDGSKLMLAAHMDEIGLFISHIEENGFLRVQPIGGIQERALAYQRVSIITRDGRVYRGVIGLKPPHAVKPEEARQIPELRELFVDIGATSKDEVKGMGIDVGDIVVFDRDVIRLNTTRVTGKAFDDRVGLVVAIKAFQLLEKNEVDV
ncbi:MAG: M42 family peptidase, partial [Ignisphaera sp.]